MAMHGPDMMGWNKARDDGKYAARCDGRMDAEMMANMPPGGDGKYAPEMMEMPPEAMGRAWMPI